MATQKLTLSRPPDQLTPEQLVEETTRWLHANENEPLFKIELMFLRTMQQYALAHTVWVEAMKLYHEGRYND